MASCDDYLANYTVTQSNCSANCTIEVGRALNVTCSPTKVHYNGQSHDATVNAAGQLDCPALSFVASVTIRATGKKYLFGVVSGSGDGAMDETSEPEVWGAEEG